MKILGSLVLACLVAGIVSAQEVSFATESNASDVSVLQKKWRREVRHPALDEDPFLAGRAAAQIEREKKEIMRVNVINKQMGRDSVPLSSRQPSLVSSVGPEPVYLYEAKVMNTGAKTIRALVWEYVFFDPDSQLDVGRHRFRSEISLRPGKNKTLGGRSRSPQTSIVDVTKTDKELQYQYSERVMINRIEYADGTFWQRDPN